MHYNAIKCEVDLQLIEFSFRKSQSTPLQSTVQRGHSMRDIICYKRGESPTEVMSRDHQNTRKRPLSRSRSRSSSRSSSRQSERRVRATFCVPNDLAGFLMGHHHQMLDNMRREVSPVTVWITYKNEGQVRTMLLRGDSQSQVDEARVKIHQFICSQYGFPVVGVLPPEREKSSESSNQDVKPLVSKLPSPAPTLSISTHRISTEEANVSSNLFQENHGVTSSKVTIPVFTEINEEFHDMISIVNQVIKIKFPFTEVSLYTVSDEDNSDQSAADSPSTFILVRAANELSVEVARMVVIKEFKEKLGISLVEPQPELKELREKLEKSQELVRKQEKEMKNLKGFNIQLEKNRAHYKDKYNKISKNEILNEKEFNKLKLKLKRSMSDYEMVVKEKQKLSKEVSDLQSQLEKHAEFIKIIKKFQNKEHQEENQNNDFCSKCPRLVFEIKHLEESLATSTALVSLREQELKLLRKQKISSKDQNSSDSEN